MQASTSKALAFAAAVAGFVGLALALVGGPAAAVGTLVAAAALLALLALAWLAHDVQGARDAPAEPQPEPAGSPASPDLGFDYAEPDMFPDQEEEHPAPEPTPTPPPAPPAPAIDLDSPLQRALAGLPPKPSAPARFSPRMPVIPEDEPGDGPVRRARRLVPSGQTLGEKREAARQAKAAPEEVEFTVVPHAPRAPVRPAVVPTPQVPLATARVAGKGRAPADLARGQCSGCGTLLWAPKQRPLNLRCPQCDKITLLR